MPDLSNGMNYFADNHRTNLQNNTTLPVPASGNYWGIPGEFVSFPASPGYTPPELVDETIIDNDENGNLGPVLFEEALSTPPPVVYCSGDVSWDFTADGVDLISVMKSWGAIIGDEAYQARKDFDGNRVIDEKDLFFFSKEWKK